MGIPIETSERIKNHLEALRDAHTDREALQIAIANIRADRSLSKDDLRDIVTQYRGYAPATAKTKNDMLKSIEQAAAHRLSEAARMAMVSGYTGHMKVADILDHAGLTLTQKQAAATMLDEAPPLPRNARLENIHVTAPEVHDAIQKARASYPYRPANKQGITKGKRTVSR